MGQEKRGLISKEKAFSMRKDTPKLAGRGSEKSLVNTIKEIAAKGKITPPNRGNKK